MLYGTFDWNCYNSSYSSVPYSFYTMIKVSKQECLNFPLRLWTGQGAASTYFDYLIVLVDFVVGFPFLLSLTNQDVGGKILKYYKKRLISFSSKAKGFAFTRFLHFLHLYNFSEISGYLEQKIFYRPLSS